MQVVALCGFDLTNAPQIIALLGGMWEKPINDSTEFFISRPSCVSKSDQRTSTQALILPGAAEIAAAGSLQGAIDVAPPIIADIQDGQGLREPAGRPAVRPTGPMPSKAGSPT